MDEGDNQDSQCIDTGFIATGKRKRGNNNFKNNEVEFEPPSPTIYAPREQPQFDAEDDFLNTQEENCPISTQPNLNFAQEPSPIQPNLNCASIEKKSDITVTHNEKFSVSAAMKTFQQLKGFSTEDLVLASTIFMNSAGMCEAFLSCNEQNQAPWIKAIIDQHKAKLKQPREELEQDADQTHFQLSRVRVISSTENGRKQQSDELEQDANQNQPQSRQVRVRQLQVMSSMINDWKRMWKELPQKVNPEQFQLIHMLGWEMRLTLSIINDWMEMMEELGLDAHQNQPQLNQKRTIEVDVVVSAVLKEMTNGTFSSEVAIMLNKINDEVLALEMMFIRKRQYDIEEAVPTLRTQRLHIEELPTHKLIFANQVPQSIYTNNKITDKKGKPIQIQLIDNNTGRPSTNVEDLHIKVKIVVIDGDSELEGLDSDKFNSKIVKQREGKGPLLVGNNEVTFNQQGVGTIGKIRFTDNSKWLRCGKVRLAACIDSERCGTTMKIQEGFSEKFVVKDQRGKSYEKKYPPKHNHDVWRLESIAKDGKYHQRLKNSNINSVQDFFKLLNANPERLKEILNMPENAWDKVVKHARTCDMELDNANLENNANLRNSPELEPFTHSPMPEFQQENMEVVMNVPVPTVDFLHAPQIHAQDTGMGQQRDPAAYFGSNQMEHVDPISSFNGNNGSSEAVQNMPEQPSTGQGDDNMDDYLSLDDWIDVN